MGWTYIEKPSNVKGWLKQELTWENDNVKRTCLEIALKLRTAYAAVETLHKATGEREVTAMVCLLDYVNDPDGRFNFGYKDLDECMGPVECDCPEGILELLTPTTGEFANTWRAKCRKNIENRRRHKVAIGQTIRFESPICWYGQTFRKVKHRKHRNVFQALDIGGGLVRLRTSTLANIPFRIISEMIEEVAI